MYVTYLLFVILTICLQDLEILNAIKVNATMGYDTMVNDTMVNGTLVNGAWVESERRANYCYQFNRNDLLSPWGIPVLLIISPVLAWLLTRFVEDPARKWLRAKRAVEVQKVTVQ